MFVRPVVHIKCMWHRVDFFALGPFSHFQVIDGTKVSRLIRFIFCAYLALLERSEAKPRV